MILSTTALAADVKEFDLGNGVTVKLKEEKFIPENHIIENCNNSNIPCLIDRIHPFGTASNMPKTYLKYLSLSKAGKTYKLNTNGMYNAWGNRPLEFKGIIKYLGAHCYDESNCTLRGLFSDAAGSFVAEWVILNGVPYRTVISSSDDIKQLFIKYIEPPHYK